MTETIFVESIEAVRNQMANDRLFQEAFELKPYFQLYSSKIIKTIVNLLHIHFPRDENGFSEIEFYLFSHNFGKPTIDSEYESPEMLWNRLTKN